MEMRVTEIDSKQAKIERLQKMIDAGEYQSQIDVSELAQIIAERIAPTEQLTQD